MSIKAAYRRRKKIVAKLTKALFLSHNTMEYLRRLQIMDATVRSQIKDIIHGKALINEMNTVIIQREGKAVSMPIAFIAIGIMHNQLYTILNHEMRERDARLSLRREKTKRGRRAKSEMLKRMNKQYHNAWRQLTKTS